MSIYQGLNMIAGAGGGGIANYDGKSITENANEEIQTVGVINSRDNSTAIKTWTGTKAQYDAITSKDSATLYNITDDTSSEDIMQTILNSVYPVGSVYITTANTCPLSTLISGSTWELVSSGRVLQGADSGHSAGTTIEAGLPNITGRIGNFDVWGFGGAAIRNVEGAFGSYGSQNNLQKSVNTQSITGGNDYRAADFNASRSSSIYGNSNTVQPPAYIVNIYRRVS